jgi:hypothetical protein
MNGMVIPAFFMIVVGIPVIGGLIYAYHEKKLKLREKELELLGGQTAQQTADQAARIEWMEDRLRVLERIVTDRGLALSDEIDRLNERTAAPGTASLSDRTAS